MTRILIADDVSANRYLLVSLLQGHGYQVAAAANGAEALALAQSSPPDLIITDILMPVMDGFDLCRRWRQDERLRHIPFVIYTATYTDPKDERLALSLGADRFVIKPQKVEVLLKIVRELLEEAGRDARAVHSEPPRNEAELLVQHKDALFRKLEAKVLQLEAEVEMRRQAEQEAHRASDALSRKTLELEGLLDAARAVLASSDFATTARRIFERARELTGARSGYVALLSDSGEENALVFLESGGVPCSVDPSLPMPIRGLRAEVYRSGKVACENDFVNSHWSRLMPAGHMELRNVMFIPLDAHGKAAGVMGLANKPEDFHEDDEKVAVALGQMLGLGLERWRDEQNLSESASLMRIAGRAARLGGWSVNLADMRVRWSDEVAAIHDMPSGYSPSVEDGIGFYTPEWRARIAEVFHACAEDGAPYDEEMEIISARGKRTWVRTIGEAVRGTSGVITGVQGAFQDITERKQVELEHQKLQNELLQSQKLESIGRLASGVAHDFNNLLSVVLGCADFAIESVREGDPLRADLAAIRQAGERAAELTRQLLAFSRKQLIAPSVLDLNKVVGGIENMLRRILGEDIEIRVRLVEDLCSIKADPGQVEQVIMNLAVNARDAMPQGGKLTIETANVEFDESCAEQHVGVGPGRFVMLSIADSGSGMDAATRSQIFEPFFTTKEKGKGTGLGLSTVYGIVKQSGGSICVYSEPGVGTTFKVYLPQADGPVAETKRPSLPRVSAGWETVLVVEDEEPVRRIVERILRSAGYRVHVASNGGEALLICERLRGELDLLLTDVVMTKMRGPELSERLSKLCPRLKTLYMSGYTDNAIVHNGVLESGTRFISKPFTAAELTRKVRESLDQASE